MRKRDRQKMAKGPGRRLVGVLVAAVAGLALSACSAGGASPNWPAPSPALWRIQDADGEVVLFGSVHLLPPGLQWRSAAFDAAITGADVVYFESPLDPDPAAMAKAVEPYQRRTPEQAPQTVAEAREQTALIAQVNERLGRWLGPADLTEAAPWLAAMIVAEAHGASLGLSRTHGVEMTLLPEVRATGTEIRALETLEQQPQFLGTLPPAAQRRLFHATLREALDQDNSQAQMTRAWLTGDVPTLTHLLEISIAEAGPEVRAAILTNRNQAWIPQIEQAIAGSGRVVIVVGAAHLVGPDSVVALLRARGHMVSGP